MNKHAYWMVSLVPLLAGVAHAEDLQPLAQRRVRAVQVGFEGRALAAFKRLPGPGRDAVRQGLLSSLEQTLTASDVRAGDAVSEDKNDVTFVRSGSGRRWFLQVRADGAAASFVDEDAMRRGRAFATTEARRLGATELEQRGRDFIARTLRDRIVVGAGEALEALSTRHLVEDSVDIAGDNYTQEGAPRVIASRVVFGRKVDGTAVIGPGSWISVTFTNDGTPVEFEYDWPAYARVGGQRTTLALDAILERASGLAGDSLDAPGVQVRHMECGYYDSTSSAASLQPACSLNYVVRAAGGEVSAHSAVIPAGVQVERDLRWHETSELDRVAARIATRAPRAAAVRQLLQNATTRLPRTESR